MSADKGAVTEEKTEEVVTAEDMAEDLAEDGELEIPEAEAAQDEAAQAEAAQAEELTLEERLDAAEAQAAEYLDGWQRARAEFANARKRLEKSRIEARRNATVDVVGRLLPILDDFERALDNVPEAVAEDSWFEGIVLVHRKLRGILDAENIEQIEAVGAPFDPNYHEAVMQEESEEYESGIVIRELQSGYRLGERVLRPAMVIVAA